MSIFEVWVFWCVGQAIAYMCAPEMGAGARIQDTITATIFGGTIWLVGACHGATSAA